MRFIGMDVHRDACQICVLDADGTDHQQRVPSRPDEIAQFAASLGPDDVVAIEATGPAGAIARILEPHAGQVVVVNPRRLGQIAARAKTDLIDAHTLSRLLAAGVLTGVWTPDEPARALRRLVSRRAAVVRARTRAKNEVHAVLARNLCPRVPVTDAFGKAGRRWLSGLALPEEELVTLTGCLRQIDTLEAEITALEDLLVRRVAHSSEVRRLLSVPGVNVIVAATFLAYVGDVGRFAGPKQLVGYLGLDPRVRQSGEAAARGGHISKQGASSVRHVLGQAAWRSSRVPGPLRAFYERICARRGPQVAITALARKLATLFWYLLTRDEDYAFAEPSVVRAKRRALELKAGSPPHKGRSGPEGPWRPGVAQRVAERELVLASEAAYRRMMADWQRTRKVGAGAATGARLT